MGAGVSNITASQVQGLLRLDSMYCRGHMGGLASGAVAAYLLGPRLVNTGACKKVFIDCPPVRWFARKGVTRYEGMKCHCVRCNMDGAGIQMRPKQKRKLKLSSRLTVIQHCSFA